MPHLLKPLSLKSETAPSVDGLVTVGDDFMCADSSTRDRVQHIVVALLVTDRDASFLIDGSTPCTTVELSRHADAAQGVDERVQAHGHEWKGYDSEHNTYEPIAHLAGCEDMIAEYIKSEKDSTLEHPLFAAFDCE